MSDIRRKIRQFILTEFLQGGSQEELKDETPLRGLGILDSMGLIQLINFIESEFKIEVEVLEADDTNLGTIDGIVALIEKKLRVKENQEVKLKS